MEPDGDILDRARRRDWYWFLGRLGQSLIVLGVLMFLFVGYQLWGTGIEESQAQNRLESRFRDYVSAEVESSSTDDVSSDASPPVPSSTWEPVVVDEGDPIAVIDIPDLGVSKYVVAGVAPGDLKKGPGHYPMTPQPGHLGNVAIAGHRTTYGEPFRDLDRLESGDDVVITDVAGRTFHYVVTDTFVVGPNDSWVVTTTDTTRALLTLTTCHPEFSAKQRLIVTAELDTSRSKVVDDRPFRYARAPEDDAPTESSVSDTVVPAITDDVVDDDPISGGSALGDGVVDDVEFEVDTFSEGWFADPGAWPHVIGWTLVLLLVVFGSWYVYRIFASRILGVAVAIAPFFVVLYFVFQNVNRLLPPNL